jgi:multidrug efflux pump subunit AcrB
MNLTEFSVRRWQFTVLVFLMLGLLGVSAWRAIPRQEDPTFPIPIFRVIAVYPGATPVDLERLVVKPLEDRMQELEQLDETDARIEDGLAVMFVEFLPSADAERKYDEVVREVNALRPLLPRELAALEVEKVSSLDVAILQLALVSDAAPYRALDSLARVVEERIETVPGIRRAERWAAPAQEVRVAPDLGRMAGLGITPGRLLQAVAGESQDLPGGSVDAGPRRYNVRTTGSYTSLEEVRRTVVAAAGGGLVRVGDVATVEWAEADPVHLGRYDGRRAVFVTATQQDGANVIAVRDAVWAELDRLERALPPSVRLERGFDQGRNVSARLSRLGADFVIAILLVLVTLLPIGTRASLIVMVSIPLSLAVGTALLLAFGQSLNQLSIVGFVIALGLLVDDSIVVVENIARFLRLGYDRMAAAVRATGEITLAVLGSTATLVLAFVPLAALPGLPGRYIRSLPLAVIFAVLASLLVSLTIIPWLASLLLREQGPGGGRALRLLLGGIERTYAPLLRWALAHRRATLAAAAALVAASAALVPVVGVSLFPKAETPQFLVDIRAPDGASLAATDRAARFAEDLLARRPEVRAVFTSVGRDNPQVYYNVIPRAENAAVGQLFVLLHGYHPRRTPVLLDSLRAGLAAYPGARIEVREFENGPPIDAPVALRITGPDLDTLRVLAARVEAVLRATPGTRYVDNPVRLRRTDLALVLDRDKAGLLGVTPAEFDRTVRLGIAGVTAGALREPDGEARPVVVRLAHEGRPGPEALDRLFVPTAAGALTPLGQVARTEFAASPPVIQRYAKERTVTVTSAVATGFNTDRVTRAALAALDTLALPGGYRLVPAGEIESRQESFGGVGGAVIVAVFMILAILVLEFGSFRSTLIVASVIPLGFVGGIAALLLTGHTLSFTATIGFVALLGIEIKTSILLVDFTNRLRAEGVPIREAVERAGQVRFLPILLTTLTAIGGLLPIALQGTALYAPLAWVIIGGLVSSTLLARLVTPVVYLLLPPRLDAAAGTARS